MRLFAIRQLLTASMALTLFCCSGAGSPAPRAEAGGTAGAGIDYTLNGNYKVRAWQNGINMGIGMYDAGSWRLLPEGRTLTVIFDKVSEGSWLHNRVSNAVEDLPYDRAATFDNFMPATYLAPYFELAGYWSGNEFRMVTDDGRTFRIRMDGPEHLPTLFEVSDQRGVFRRMEWAYFKVGEVSRKNFSPPEGAVPKGE